LNNNNDGEAAPVLPTFENFEFKNIDLSAASVNEPVININGFKDPAHKLKNVSFTNIAMPAGGKIMVNDAEQVKFTEVRTPDGVKPMYVVQNSTGVIY
jgi:hypothetical protein